MAGLRSMLVPVLLLFAAVTLFGTVHGKSATPFVSTDTLNSFYANLYGIPVPAGGDDPDVLITLTVIGDGNVDLYCNPRWGQYTEVASNFPQPGYAVWFSDYSKGQDQVYISKNDPLYRPPEARNPNTTAYREFTPSFICSVINVDANNRVTYRIEATMYDPADALVISEVAAVKNIWDSCCTAVPDGPNATRCATWAAANEANNGSLVTNFCDFEGQYCSEAGQLLRLDLSSYNLKCPLPLDDILSFPALTQLNLGNNTQLTGDMGETLHQLSRLRFLSRVDFSGCSGIGGQLQAPGTTGLCTFARTSLVELDIPNMNLTGPLPECLVANGSVLTELYIAGNNLTGTIPNVFSSNSLLEILSAANNKFNGTIPPSLVFLPALSTLDLSNNSLTGSIPPNLGYIPSLKNIHLKYNQLTGAVPSSLVYSKNLETLDLKDNRLSALPAEWLDPLAHPTAMDAITNSTLVTARLSFNRFTGPFPLGFAYTNVSFLMLNSNGFSGPLPDVPNGFVSLRALNISDNHFNGTLPAGFGKSGIFNLPPLEYTNGNLYEHVFDVSHNNLSGPLPSFLNQSAVPSYARGGIYVSGNAFTYSCVANVTSYIADICSGIPSVGGPRPSVSSANGTSPASSGSSTSMGTIIGIVAGVLAALAVAAGGGYAYLRRRKRQQLLGIQPGTTGPGAFMRWNSAFNEQASAAAVPTKGRYRPDLEHDGLQLNKQESFKDDANLLQARFS